MKPKQYRDFIIVEKHEALRPFLRSPSRVYTKFFCVDVSVRKIHAWANDNQKGYQYVKLDIHNKVFQFDVKDIIGSWKKIPLELTVKDIDSSVIKEWYEEYHGDKDQED